MSELMDKVLADKLADRKRIVALPVDQKLRIMEKLRDRSLLIQRPRVAVLSAVGARLEKLTPPVSHQLQEQLHTLQNSKTLFVELRKPRLPKDAARGRFISTRVSGPEYDTIHKAIKKSGQVKTEWVRNSLLSAAKSAI